MIKEIPMSDSHRILVAVDESPTSGRAVAYVADMIGGKTGFHVGLLHMELPPRMLEWGGSEDPDIEDKVEAERDATYRQMEKERLAQGKTLLQHLKAILTDKGIDVVAQCVRFEEPLDRKNLAQNILATAKERDYGTIVVGRHSVSRWERFFKHPVGEELVRTGAHVTIWVVE
jgi:nucleotide-binding universal stress UspA family protein